MHHLLVERRLADSTVNVRLQGGRFFYTHVVHRADFDLRVPTPSLGRSPQVLSRDKVGRVAILLIVGVCVLQILQT